ncbi:MAG TPA: metal-dependent transcriptional regulator [Candidatus Hydrogenedentes bacterium]|nr:metal-dependent transcriptional regulator [Candidatus Hydrogenedentota bacterium]
MASASQPLSSSLEDYLEAIYRLLEQDDVARVKDIAARLGVRSASVTGALHALSDRGLVNYAPYDAITLTCTGASVAREMVRRHEALRDFFMKVLAVDPRKADDTACRVEHAVPPDIIDRFVAFMHFAAACPRVGFEWAERFAAYCRHGEDPGRCRECIQEALDSLPKDSNA